MAHDINVSEENIDNEHSILSAITDPESCISSKEIIDAIKPMDAAIDVIGVVKNINEPLTKEKDGKKYIIFNFELECQSNTMVPIAVWDDDIDRIKPFIMLNYIIHLDGPFARPQESKYSKYGKDYILTCRSNTIVNNLGKMKNIEPEVETFDEYYSIADGIADINKKKIALVVYLKTEFRKDTNSKGIGVVTDGIVKLTVYIHDFDTNVLFEKGECLKIIGTFFDTAKHIYFEISNMDNIYKFNDEKISVETLQKIIQTPKRRMAVELKNIDKPKKYKSE